MATTSHGEVLSSRHVAQRRHVLSGLLQFTYMANEAIEAAVGPDVRGNLDLLVLLTLHTDGPQRPRDLTALTGLTRGGTTNMIDRLESRDLVRRQPVSGDRRGVLVEITTTGTETVEAVVASAGRVITFAGPLIDSWREHLATSAPELGRRWQPRGGRQVLEHVRRFSSATSKLRPVYDAALGPDDPAPHLSMHVLLLATEPGGTRPSWISDAAQLSSASTSDMLERLESRDLVTRITGASSDGRVTLITATERGRAALDTIIVGSDAAMAAVATVLFPPGD